MSVYRQQLEAAARAVTITAPTQFAWFGKPSAALPRKTLAALDRAAARAHLVSGLRRRLYTAFYATGGARPSPPPEGGLQRSSEFVESLSEANAGSGPWSDGWVVRSVRGDDVVAERDGIRFTVGAGWWRAAPGAAAIQAGDRVLLRMPREQLGISPGFYLAQSDTELEARSTKAIVRVYFNVAPPGASRLMATLTRELNRSALFFRFKIAAHPARFTRCDSAVLYLAVEDFERAAGVIGTAYDDAETWMQPGVPAFTKVLRPGLGLAEHPEDSESFGWHRSGLVADAIVRAHDQGVENLAERVDAVIDGFEAAGVRISTPYLNPGSSDPYVLPPSRSRGGREAHTRSSAARRDQGAAFRIVASGETPRAVVADPAERTGDALRTAVRIAERLADTAYWYADRCTWFGPDMPNESCDSPLAGLSRRALGSDVYSGTSGVGLFLAEAARVAHHDAVRAAALGAIRQALFRLSADATRDSWGLYCGWPGVALAAAHVARLLDEPTLLDRTRRLVHSMLETQTAPDGHFDVISGGAGAALAFVLLAELLDAPSVLAAAEAAGRRLCQSAERSATGTSWRGPGQRRGRNLTGYSHGAAGAAHALFELWAATGDERFAETADQAVAYERKWFSPAVCNWPDFRVEHEVPKRYAPPPSFQTAWCHGAPGIALGRTRAWMLVGDSRYQDEAAAALDTTVRALEQELVGGRAEVSLCHGIVGNAEVVAYASARLGRTAPHLTDIVERAARHVATVAHDRLGSSDVADGFEDPGLMLGAAGLGHFLLRVARPETTSVLCVARPETTSVLGVEPARR